jgi:uncharacterized protein
MNAEPEQTAFEKASGRMIAALSAQAAVFAGLGLLLWIWSGRAAGDFVILSWTGALTGVALAAALILLAFVLFRGFPNIGERLVRLQAPTFSLLGPRLGWLPIVLLSLGAGIGEEALLRAGLQTLLGDHLGPMAAILLSSAAFAAIHWAKPVITALLFVIGAIFGVAFWYTGSLLAVMIGHALYDMWALRYLHREMHRLNLFDQPKPRPEPEPEPQPAPLVNSRGPG